MKRFENKGFKLVAMKFMQASEELLNNHYADLSSKGFFACLIKYIASGPVLAMVCEGLNAVKTGRVMLGATNPADSSPGTIRSDLCVTALQLGELSEGLGLRVDSHHPAQARQQQTSHKLVFPQHNQ